MGDKNLEKMYMVVDVIVPMIMKILHINKNTLFKCDILSQCNQSAAKAVCMRRDAEECESADVESEIRTGLKKLINEADWSRNKLDYEILQQYAREILT
jgi:hypothetical protein